jgi:hypothetical protein
MTGTAGGCPRGAAFEPALFEHPVRRKIAPQRKISGRIPPRTRFPIDTPFIPRRTVPSRGIFESFFSE